MAKKKVQKKSKKKVPEQSKKVTLQESFGKLLEFKYLGLLIAGVYFIVLLIISLLYHKVGDYGVETDFFWGYVPEAKSFINGYLKIIRHCLNRLLNLQRLQYPRIIARDYP